MLFGHERFWTTLIEDRKQGFSGLRLHRERFKKTTIAAEIIYWDASGGFTVQTTDGDVPIEIIEFLISETKNQIKFR